MLFLLEKHQRLPAFPRSYVRADIDSFHSPCEPCGYLNPGCLPQNSVALVRMLVCHSEISNHMAKSLSCLRRLLLLVTSLVLLKFTLLPLSSVLQLHSHRCMTPRKLKSASLGWSPTSPTDLFTHLQCHSENSINFSKSVFLIYKMKVI